jgi:hypothetical protein
MKCATRMKSCFTGLLILHAAIWQIANAQRQLDYLWIIQNSGSMADDLDALAAAAPYGFFRQLQLASIDWRVAVAYTDSDRPETAGTCPGAPGPGRGVICPFAADSALFLHGNSNAAFVRSGTCGSGIERGFASARAAIEAFLAGSGCLPGGSCVLRPGAKLVVIFFTNTGEQTTLTPPPGQPDTSVTSWVNYFRDYDLVTPGLQSAQVHGVLCPYRPPVRNCGDNLVVPNLFERYSELIRRMNGFEGNLADSALPSLPNTLAQLVNASLTSVPPNTPSTDFSFALDQAYPNPFNPSTTIRFSLQYSSFTTLDVFNIMGERVTTLVSENLSAGSHQAVWNAEGYSSGVYFYHLSARTISGSQAGSLVETRKLILLK